MSSVDSPSSDGILLAGTESTKAKLEKPKKTQSQGIQLLPLVLKSIRSGGILLAVWLVGYTRFNLSWVLVAVLVYVGGKEYLKFRERKKALESGTVIDDEEVTMARADELPSWVYYPDVERAEWLNKMLQQMWPNIGEYVKNLVKTTIEPLINSNMPSQLTPFKFEQIDVGNIPPRIGGMKVYIENIRRDEIIMDIEFTCASDAYIKVSVRGLPAGVKDVMVHGTVRVVMTPLVSKIPIVGGFSVFFLNQPKIDFDLTDVGQLLDLPLLSTSLRTIVSDEIANYLVLPNKIPFTIIETASSEPQFTFPQGVVCLEVIEGSALKKADIGLGKKGKSDPYCKVIAGGLERKTKVIDNTIAPEWKETFEFVIGPGRGQAILFEVFDKDPGTQDDDLGRTSLDIDSLLEARSVDRWLTLEDVSTGRLHVKAKWLFLSKDVADLNSVKSPIDGSAQLFSWSALLLVNVDSAKDLPMAPRSILSPRTILTEANKRTMTEPSPFVRLEVGNKEERTTVKNRSTNPNWNEKFEFIVADPEQQDLTVEVYDHTDNHRLGVIKIPIEQLMELDDMTVSRPYALKEATTRATIYLSLCLRILSTAPPPDYDSFVDKTATDVTPPKSSIPSASGNLVESTEPRTAVPLNSNTSDSGLSSKTGEEVVFDEPSIVSGEVEGGNVQEMPAAESTPSGLRYRGSAKCASDGRFGRIQLTIRYSAQRERLIIVIHQCLNLIPCDQDSLADPYIKCYLLPDKSSKKKTQTQKDTLNPVFDETFDWQVSKAELTNRTLDITVKNNVGVFSKNRAFIGLLQLKLSDFDDLSQSITEWFDLCDPDVPLQ